MLREWTVRGNALDIRVHRKNMEVPRSLREAAERKLAKLEAFLDDSGWIEVGFVEEQNPRIAEKYHCEIVAHVKGHRLKVEGSAGEPLSALERATDKVDKQVRRLKDKRVGRRPRRTGGADHSSGNGEVDPIPTPGGRRTGLPAIVETAEVDGKPMTPVEAAMQLQVLSEDFLLFFNVDTGRASVVYQRGDGDYGLVEMPA